MKLRLSSNFLDVFESSVRHANCGLVLDLGDTVELTYTVRADPQYPNDMGLPPGEGVFQIACSQEELTALQRRPIYRDRPRQFIGVGVTVEVLPRSRSPWWRRFFRRLGE